MTAAAKIDPKPRWRRTLHSAESFSDDLGAIGAWVGPRVGSDKRTHDQKEEYCLRRFLVALKRTDRLSFPAVVEHLPPGKGPDYVIAKADDGSFGLEVTEAGSKAHQATMTQTENTGKPYRHPISEREASESISSAIKNKMKKKNIYKSAQTCDLLVYDNTRSGGFVDKRAIMKLIRKPKNINNVFRRVHLLSGQKIYYDIFGNRVDFIDLSTDYDIDFAEWIKNQVNNLRSIRMEGLDIAHLIEELEDLGQRNRREFRSQLIRIMKHLLKWRYQPTHGGTSWKVSIVNARGELNDLLANNPSFANSEFLFAQVEAAYRRARREAAAETELPLKTFPEDCPFDPAELLDSEFFPD